MGNTQTVDGYLKLDDRGRLTLTKKHLDFLHVKPGDFVRFYVLEKEQAIAIEKPPKGSTI